MVLIKFITSNLLKRNRRITWNCSFSKIEGKPPWKVLFFGTDEFSIFSLKALTNEYRKGHLIDKLEVVTSIKGKSNPVKKFTEKEGLLLHEWPPNITPAMYDVGLVVSFGHLIPEHIIDKFKFGMLNVHASLLPRWRGAAPIIYAIANGDSQTGVTIMKISPKKFDIGEIILQESIQITPDMKMPELHSKLGILGADTLIRTLESLPSNLNRAYPQPTEGISYAPKVNPSFACIQWETMSSRDIYNRQRALHGCMNLQTVWKESLVKLINVKVSDFDTRDYTQFRAGFVQYDKQKHVLRVMCADRKFITIEKIGVIGKKIMTAKDFNNGYLKKEVLECRYFK